MIIEFGQIQNGKILLFVKSSIELDENNIKIEIEKDNLFIKTYRSYNDRLKYFSDAKGIDFVLRMFVPLKIKIQT